MSIAVWILLEVFDGDQRYCLCKNPIRATKETQTRQVLLEKTTAELDKILACTRKTKYSKDMRVAKVINPYNTGKYIQFEGQGDTLRYTLNEAEIQEEAALDGCYIIYTDVSAQQVKAIEVVESYKRLIRVEQAFRNIKTVTLEIRPIYHKTDDRIRCHVFLCMLAYYVMWHMKQRLQPLFETDGKGAKRKFTFDYVMNCLKSIRKETIELGSVTTTKITAPTKEQRCILELLQIKI